MAVRKCFECEKPIEFDTNNMDDLIRFEKLFYHYDCFINVCKRKSKSKKALPKWGEALNSIDKIHQETKQFFETNSDNPKDKLYKFLLETYDISKLPSHFFIKLENIYTGKLKGLGCSIPPEDLLDMWERKQKLGYFDKMRAKNITSGKEMTGYQKLNYDLAVIINQYYDYLRWKERNKIIEQDVNKVHVDILKTVDLEKLSKIAQNQNKEDEEDIDSLLDELFD